MPPQFLQAHLWRPYIFSLWRIEKKLNFCSNNWNIDLYTLPKITETFYSQFIATGLSLLLGFQAWKDCSDIKPTKFSWVHTILHPPRAEPHFPSLFSPASLLQVASPAFRANPLLLHSSSFFQNLLSTIPPPSCPYNLPLVRLTCFSKSKTVELQWKFHYFSWTRGTKEKDLLYQSDSAFAFSLLSAWQSPALLLFADDE